MTADARFTVVGGGLPDVGGLRAGCRPADVLPSRDRDRVRLARKKDARPMLQHRTGVSNRPQQLTLHSLAQKEKLVDLAWAAIGVCALIGLPGVALAECAIRAAESAVAALRGMLGPGTLTAFAIFSLLAAIAAALFALFRLCFKNE